MKVVYTSTLTTKYTNLMKKILILIVFAFFVVIAPLKAHAFELGQLIDPLCLFACDNDDRQTVNTTITDSYNVGSYNTGTTIIGTTDSSAHCDTCGHPQTPNYPTYSQLGASCFSTPTAGNVGDSISWRSSTYGGSGNYYITWSGNDSLSGYGTSISKTYNRPGSKYASITVTSGNQTITRNCSTNVEIRDNHYYDYDNSYSYNNNNNNDYNNNNYYNSPIYVSCTANTTFAPVETNVIWSANVSGGNGNYNYNWSGTDYLGGSSRTQGVVYHSPGTKTASVTVRSGNQTVTQYCSNSVLVGVPTYYNNNYVAPAPVIKYVPVKTVVKEEVKVTKVEDNNDLSASALFSLENVPWGWVAVLIILVLFGTILYLIYNRNKI